MLGRGRIFPAREPFTLQTDCETEKDHQAGKSTWDGFTCGNRGDYPEEDTIGAACWQWQAERCGQLLKAIFIDRPKKGPGDSWPLSLPPMTNLTSFGGSNTLGSPCRGGRRTRYVLEHLQTRAIQCFPAATARRPEFGFCGGVSRDVSKVMPGREVLPGGGNSKPVSPFGWVWAACPESLDI